MKTSGILLLSCLFPVSITGKNCGSCINAGKKFHNGKCYAPDEDCPQDGAACCATKECCRLRRETCKKCTKSGHTFQWNGRFQRSRGTCYEDTSGAAVCDPASDPSCCDGRTCCDTNRFVDRHRIPGVDSCAACVGARLAWQGGGCLEMIGENECPIADLECCTELGCCGPKPQNVCAACVGTGLAWQNGECVEMIGENECPIADLDCCTELGCCGLKPQNEIGTCDRCVNNGFMWEKSGCTDVVGNMIEPGTCPGEEGSCCTPDSLQDCCLVRFPTISEPEPLDYCEACVRAGRPFQGGACEYFIDGDNCPIADLECCTELACCGPKPENHISTCQECFDGGFTWTQSGSGGACSNVVEMLPPGMCPGEEGSCCTEGSLPKCCLQFPA